jgi:hypothetical protein
MDTVTLPPKNRDPPECGEIPRFKTALSNVPAISRRPPDLPEVRASRVESHVIVLIEAPTRTSGELHPLIESSVVRVLRPRG